MSRVYAKEHIVDMVGYAPGEQPKDGDHYIKLNTNENAYPPSERVSEVLSSTDIRSFAKYPDPGCSKIRAICSQLYGVSPSQVLVGNGSDELLAYICRLSLKEGGTVGSLDPSYSLYPVLANTSNAQFRKIPLTADYSVPTSFDTRGVDILFIANPNAPTGIAVNTGLISEICQSTNGLVVVDEAYVDFAPDGTCAIPLLDRYENLVVLRTLSKAYSLAGMRVGLLFGNAEYVYQLNKIRDSYNVNTVSQTVAAAALLDQEWMRCNVARIISTRQRCSVSLNEFDFCTIASDANFILTKPPKGLPAAVLYKELKARKILVRYFDIDRVRDYIRVTIGTDTEIDTFLNAVREIT
jgi:histidinol-phosphate aminotransferase